MYIDQVKKGASQSISTDYENLSIGEILRIGSFRFIANAERCDYNLLFY